MGYIDPSKKREYAREWIAKRRKTFFSGKTCIDCGSSENLELDHVDRKLKVSHKIWSWSKERREIELVKCVVRCHSCHIIKTKVDMNGGYIVHGSRYRGYANGCRCILCKEAQAKYN